MNIETTEKFTHITSDEGKILVSGDIRSTSAYLPLGADVSAWIEVNQTVDGSELIQLSRDKVVEWCKQNSFYTIVMQVLSTDQLAASWFYGTCDFLANSPNALYLQSKLKMSDEQIQSLVEYSKIT